METPKPQTVLFDRKMKRNLFLLVCCQAVGQSANTMMFIATALSACVTSPALADIQITVDKGAQTLTVARDGQVLHKWPVSTGRVGRFTPSGSYQAFRMEKDHFSREFDDAPMPHSIFFTKIGHAIHGTDSVNRLGSPASHGCVRLSRANAATLYALVQEQGVLNTTVTLTGSSQVALARNPRGRANTAVARRAPIEQEQPSDSAGDPVVITPQAGYAPQPGYAPQAGYASQPRRDDGYIYPADGSSNQQIYPAPRRAQAYPPQQYYYDRSYAPAPQGYYQPRPYYQQQRGYYTYQD